MHVPHRGEVAAELADVLSAVTDVSLRCRVTSGFSLSPRMMLPTERARMAFWAALSTLL